VTVNGSNPDWLNPVPFGDVAHGQLPGNTQQWDALSEDQLRQMREQLLESIISAVVQAVRGLFVPGPFGAALDQLSGWANNLPTLSDVFQNIVTVVAKILGAPNPETITLVGLGEWVLETVFGIVMPDRVPVLPISHLTDGATNLLSNPMFTGSAPISTVQPGSWVLDTAVSQNGIGGSARIDADGGQHDLLSTDFIPLTTGQSLEISSWVKTEGLVGANGIVIGVACYTKADGSDAPRFVTLASPSQTGTTDWQQWSGVYTATEGVVGIRVHLAVLPQVFGGKVWFDNLFAGKKGLLQIDWVSNLGETLTDAADGIAQLFAGLQESWNTLLSALTGKPQEQATPQLTAEQITELLATTAANTTALAALQTAVQGGLTNLVASGDDFERDQINLPGQDLWDWVFEKDPALNGGYGVSRGQLVWQDKGNVGNRVRFLRVNPADRYTKTAYQRVCRVIGTQVAEAGVPLLGLKPALDTTYARVSDDFSKYVVAYTDGDGVTTLRYNVGAGEKDFLDLAGKPVRSSGPKPTAGSSYAIECGDPGDLRSYRVLRNNVTVLAHEDTAGVSAPLDSLRGWGWGGEAVARGLGQGTPSSIHSITVADIPPDPTIGTFLHVVRDAKTALTKPVGEALLPSGTFNQIVRNSPDVTFDVKFGTQVILIAKPGPYTLSLRVSTEADILGFDEWELLLYRITGTAPSERWLLFRSAQTGSPGASIGQTAPNSIEATFQFYSAGINQQYAVGFGSKNQVKIAGSAGGDTTWMTLTRGV
jgi:hypothetical protein